MAVDKSEQLSISEGEKPRNLCESECAVWM